MVVYRRRGLRRVVKKMPKRKPRMLVSRGLRPTVRTFTEVLNAGQIYTSTASGSTANGQVWKCKFTDLPQNQEYSKLYRQFAIKKLQLILLPRNTVPDLNNQQGFVGSGGYGSIRLAWSVDSGPTMLAPTSEIDVLTANGSKVVVQTSRKIVINCKPQADVITSFPNAPAAVFAASRRRGLQWFNTDNTDVAYSGTNIEHGAIRTYATLNFVGPVTDEASVFAYDVYYKITFCLRDPA